MEKNKNRPLDAEEEQTNHAPTKKICMPKFMMTDMEFADRFTDNEFGYVCSVCDSLWYKRDIRGIPDKSIAMLTDK